jgi:hypothetical protein
MQAAVLWAFSTWQVTLALLFLHHEYSEHLWLHRKDYLEHLSKLVCVSLEPYIRGISLQCLKQEGARLVCVFSHISNKERVVRQKANVISVHVQRFDVQLLRSVNVPVKVFHNARKACQRYAVVGLQQQYSLE